MDKRIKELLNKELERQQNHIELIASENYVSEAVLEATGSIATNKYAEGYPFKRYYGGCEFVDQIEQLAIDTVKEIFKAEYANVQPHSGSQANMAIYQAFLKPGDKIVAMDLDAGGHLTHGSSVSFSGKDYVFAHYGVNKETYLLDYDEIEKIVAKEKPKLIVAGASAYPRAIDFKKFREIADKYNTLLMVDMAHIAGLVAVGLHQNPVEYADVVTSTTHKTLRGARGGLILAKEKYAKQLNSAVFPGIQGGPLEHVIAGKAQAFIEATKPEFKLYIKNVIDNCSIFAEELAKNGLDIITGGTDNHLLIADVKKSFGITGRQAETILNDIGIVSNKNMIPFDTESAFKTSGIRLGTAAMTTRGFGKKEFTLLAKWITSALSDRTQENWDSIKKEVYAICKNFPIYKDLKY
ncbi:glycine hydroxymethyltransferase [Spiroplasma sp. TIUS-1]|uniref:serine hydroxymethyltransferase n=1 Tax=Spiroplasma sp. TIUS-1 TaxID=216963 RepID=UPI00139841BF|nr:serine hydroxymethyltransferase [Spiroplasma sp. TIUS-1]QHX35600.1 glycine hydroxymethyltransferase [Spiroplasma sp. TIUS-1]